MVKVLNPEIRGSFSIVLPDFSKQNVNSIDANLLIELYKKFGAILIRGFGLSVESFQKLTTSLCTHSVKNLSPGRETIDKKNNIQAVDPGTDPFPLHPEMSRLPWKPDICFFGCLNAPESGGETIICDGIELVKRLPSKILKQINRRKLSYTHSVTKEEALYWLDSKIISENVMENAPEDCPFEFIFHKNKVLRIFTTPFLHKPMFVNRLAFGNYLLFARYIHQDIWFPVFEDGSIVPSQIVQNIKKIGDKISAPISWQKNDILIIDNTRFLHGRNKIHNLKQRRILTYFGFLNFANVERDPVRNARWRNPNWSFNF